MVSRKAVAVLLVVHVAAMLASQTEAFVPIFTYSEFQKMQEKEQNKGRKKSLSVQQRSEEVGPLLLVEPTEEEENQVVKLTAPVEIGIRMNSRQLEKYRAALEGLLSEALLSTQNGKGRVGASAATAGIWPLPPLIFGDCALFFCFALETMKLSSRASAAISKGARITEQGVLTAAGGQGGQFSSQGHLKALP
ncbi:Promotilin [Galemys pyrenaicus]|uniref:Promotilin n=1 Tax=Galemys pyrenaicus TaxID=202257 RepID=A0A8J6A0L3_GALPY|nr:Promotilin [Galemys pyrenaicus]